MNIEFAKEIVYAGIPVAQHPIVASPNWEARATAAECALFEAQDAIRCAVDWLQLNAPGRALEVLEANMR